jgi:hypothetical protein
MRNVQNLKIHRKSSWLHFTPTLPAKFAAGANQKGFLDKLAACNIANSSFQYILYYINKMIIPVRCFSCGKV